MTTFKRLAKAALCGAYKYSGAAGAVETAAQWSGKRFLAILLFHRVTDQIPEDGLTVSTARFRAICHLLQRRFRVVSVSELAHLHRSRQPLPPRTVAVTFDDCYRDNLFAARVLAEHGLAASFFLPTAFLDTDHVFPWDHHLPPMPNLTWNDVREMAALGHTIGSHTVNHLDLGKVSLPDAQREIVESKQVIEDKIGAAVRWFAYPYGGVQHFRPGLASYVEEAGYEGCLSGYGGFIYADSDSRLLPREAVPYFSNVLNLELHLRGCLDFVYAAKRRLGLMEERPQMARVQEQVIKAQSDPLMCISSAEDS
jgi:peptidoglycan/xylan/chitin deacetylase (PgdA/CDA1 family)